jgi:hypothetical protein
MEAAVERKLNKERGEELVSLRSQLPSMESTWNQKLKKVQVFLIAIITKNLSLINSTKMDNKDIYSK